MLMFPAQLPKYHCMGNVMKFLSPYLSGFYLLSGLGYHTLLVLGKDIPLKYVFKHIFLAIVLIKSDRHFSLSIGLFKPFL